MMHARSIRSSPKQLPITTHTETTGGTIRTLPIYTSRSYDHNLRNVVSVPAEEHKIYPHLDPSCQHTRTVPMCPTPHG